MYIYKFHSPIYGEFRIIITNFPVRNKETLEMLANDRMEQLPEENKWRLLDISADR